MPRLRTLTIGIAATALASGTLAMGGATSAAATHHAPAAAAAAKHGATVSTRHTKLGTVIVGPNGHTLYLFEKDTTHKSHCYRSCATVWPALMTKGTPHAAGKAKAGLLGTTTRKNGKKQVTYAGHPVYYYIGDTAAGQTHGEGLKQFGAEWYVVNPHGKKIDNG